MKIDINMIKILGIELAERGYYINLNNSIDSVFMYKISSFNF